MIFGGRCIWRQIYNEQTSLLYWLPLIDWEIPEYFGSGAWGDRSFGGKGTSVGLNAIEFTFLCHLYISYNPRRSSTTNCRLSIIPLLENVQLRIENIVLLELHFYLTSTFSPDVNGKESQYDYHLQHWGWNSLRIITDIQIFLIYFLFCWVCVCVSVWFQES